MVKTIRFPRRKREPTASLAAMHCLHGGNRCESWNPGILVLHSSRSHHCQVRTMPLVPAISASSTSSTKKSHLKQNSNVPKNNLLRFILAPSPPLRLSPRITLVFVPIKYHLPNGCVESQSSVCLFSFFSNILHSSFVQRVANVCLVFVCV